MALGLPNGIPFCWQPPVKTASDIESSPNLRISADGGVSEFSNGCLDGRAFSLVQASPVGVLPSLLIVPQSYKSGKLYAQLPNARVNHIPNNSMFGASGGVLPSGWTFSVGAASGVSLGYSASGQVTAEDGTLVDYIDFTFSGTATASGFLNLRPNASPSTISSVSGQSWNASVYLQLISGSVASISPTYQLQETTSGGTFINGSNITGLGSLTTSLPLRRYNVTRDLDTSGTVVTCRWGHSIASGTAYNYTLRIASPQLENLSSPTSVIRTVSGAVYAPYSGENVRTNLAFHSELWASGSNWQLSDGGTSRVTRVSGSTDAFKAPDGTFTANAISPTSGDVQHYLFSNSPTTIAYTSGTIYTQSAFFKAGGTNLPVSGSAGRYVQLTFNGTTFTQLGFANFDLQLGTVAVVSGSSADTNRAASIENYGNGWYRCRLTATCTSSGSTTGLNLVLITTSGDIRRPSFAGTVTDVLYGWGAQVETGSSATPYIRTTTAPNSFPIASIADFTVSRNTTATRVNSSGLIESVASGVPRIDWLGQSCPALLVEASGQNGILNSTDTTTNWTCWSGFTSGVIDVLGVSGVNLQVNTSGSNIGAGTGNGNIARTNNNVALASGSTYTLSFFIKKTGAHTIGGYYASITGAASGDLGGGFNVSGSFSSGSIYNTAGTTNRIRRVEQWGTDVYRCSETFTMTASGTLTTFRLAPVSGVTLASLAAVGTELGFAAPQIELSSVPTTFIPTTTAAVSRAADVISASGALVSGLIGQTEGTIYAEVVAQPYNNSLFPAILQVEDGADSQRFALFVNASGGVRLRLNSTNNNIGLDATSPTSLIAGQVYKIAAAFAFDGTSALYINGVFQASGSVASGPFSSALNRVNVGSRGGAFISPSRIRSAALYTTRLSNDQLAELTRL